MSEDWLSRWEQGRTGWHEAAGNRGLRQYWPELPAGSRVLVPLCGKAVDLLWLAERGMAVSGVELSEVAVRSFFAEHQIGFEIDDHSVLPVYRATDRPLSLYCGDYFRFADEPYDALYDRGALVALPGQQRPDYVAHTKDLLLRDAFRLVITLEYDQSAVDGPPFSVLPDEVMRYWHDLERVDELCESDSIPPKFRAAGLQSIIEAVWAPETRSGGR